MARNFSEDHAASMMAEVQESQGSSKMDTYLPIEIVTHILGYLKVSDRLNAGLCCKLWYSVSLQSIFWSDIHFNICKSVDEAFSILKNTRKPIQHIVLKDISNTENNQLFLDFFRHVGNTLQSLNIQNSFLSDNDLKIIFLNCCYLECLKISNCPDIYLTSKLLQDKDNEMHLIQKSMPSLSELYLDDNLSYITDMSVEKLLKFVTKLRTLSLAGTSVSFHPGTYHRYYPRGSENEDASNLVLTFNQVLSHIIKNSTSINHLDFSKTNFNDKAALVLSQVTGLKLQNLYFKGCDIGPTGLAAICETQRTLIELDLSACARITDSALAILSANLPCLQFLSLQSCRSLTDVGISKLNQLKELRHINLQGLGTITANGVEVGLFSHPSRLIKINVSATCIQTTTINQMASYCHRLTYLNLTSCTAAVTDDNLHIILESFILLRYLILDWCVNISDAGFTKRANDVTRRREMNTNSARENVHMPNGLIYLSLAGCSKITDRTLISSQFQELRYLNLTSCIAVTVAGLLSTSRSSPSLEVLILSHCLSLTDGCVIAIVESLARLRFLDVQGCKQLSEFLLAFINKYDSHPTYLNIIRSW